MLNYKTSKTEIVQSRLVSGKTTKQLQRLLLAILIMAGVQNANAQLNLKWSHTQSLSGGVYPSHPVGIYDDSSTWWITSNETINPAGDIQGLISKYDSSGNLLWNLALTPAVSLVNFPNGGIVNNLGSETWHDIVAYNTSPTTSHLIKVNPNGTIAWDVISNGMNNISSICPDGDFLYVNGRTPLATCGAFQCNGIAVAKYDTNGVQQWIQTNYTTGYFTMPSQIVVDSTGNVIVSGKKVASSNTTGNFDTTFVTKYTPTGSALWTKEFNEVTYDSMKQIIAADENGDNYFSTTFRTSTSSSVTLRKLASSAGAVLWTQTINNAELNGIQFDNGTGEEVLATSSGMFAYNAAGTLMWSNNFSVEPDQFSSCVNVCGVVASNVSAAEPLSKFLVQLDLSTGAVLMQKNLSFGYHEEFAGYHRDVLGVWQSGVSMLIEDTAAPYGTRVTKLSPCSSFTYGFTASTSFTNVTAPNYNNGSITVNWTGTFNSWPHLEIWDDQTGLNIAQADISYSGAGNYVFQNLNSGHYTVKTFDESCGEQDFNVTLVPANDDCANAIVLGALGTACVPIGYSSAGATASAGTPTPSCGFYAGGDVWFTAVVPASGNIRIEISNGVGINPQFAVYTGPCGSLTQYVCNQLNPDRTISDASLAGQPIFIRVYNYNTSAGGTFNLCVWEPPVPANDNCANATPLTVGTSCTPVNTTCAYATTQPASVAPNPSCGFWAGCDVWYSVVMPVSGSLIIERTNGTANAQFALYSGTCGNMAEVACAQLNNTMTVNNLLLVGQTLYLRVWNFNSQEGGTLSLCAYQPTVVSTATISGNSAICLGQPATVTLAFTGAPPYNYTVSDGTQIVFTGSTTGMSASLNITPATAGSANYTITSFSDANGVGTTSGSAVVTVNPNPVVTISGNTSICQGGSTTLTANGGDTYTWSPATGLNTTTGSTVIATPANSYTVTVTGINGFGCTASTATTVQVNPNPTVTISGNTSICQGGSTTLTANGGDTYTWSPATCLNTTTGSTVIATPANSYTVTVTGINGFGCTASTATTVNVSTASPTGSVTSITAPARACAGDVSLLTANTVAGQNVRYRWRQGVSTSVVSFSNNIGGPFSAPPFETTTRTVYVQFGALGASATTYNVTSEAFNGCGSTNIYTKSIAGKAAMPGTVTGAIVACPNDIKNYSCGASSGATVYNWTLSGSGTAITSGMGTQNVQVTFPAAFTTGQMCVTAQFACGVSSVSAPRCKTISNAPATPGTMTGPSSICPGSSGVGYSIAAVAEATGYNWTVPTGATITSGAGSNSIQLAFSAAYSSGTVRVAALSACGASPLRSKTINSSVPSKPNAITGPPTNICNSTVQYSVVNTVGVTYTWTPPAGTSITSGQGSSVILLSVGSSFTSGSLSVTANTNLCTPGTSSPRTLTIYGRPATPSVITANPGSWCNGGFVTFSVATVSPQPSNNWTVTNGSITAGQGSNNIAVTWGLETGYVVAVASNTCGFSGASSQYYSTGCREGELTGTDIFGITVYPNPVGSVLEIRTSANFKNTTLQLKNVLGQVVFEKNTGVLNENTPLQINVADLPTGIYLLQLNTEEGVITKRIVKE